LLSVPTVPYEEIDPKTIKVGIVGNPEIERMRWLEEERLRPPPLQPTGCLPMLVYMTFA
jgi:hypothetical protein